MSGLTSVSVQNLNWSQDNSASFYFPNLVRIATPTDGSCFFHAIIMSFYEPYQTGKMGGLALDRTKFILNLRRDLASKLEEPIDPLNPNSPRYYDKLSRGTMAEFAKACPEYTLENIQRTLRSIEWVDYSLSEFISNILQKDIYILDAETRDVYILGDASELLFKGRQSLVLLFHPGHFELVGLRDTATGNIQTLFSPDHPLIQSIRDRYRILEATKKNRTRRIEREQCNKNNRTIEQ